MKFLLSFLALFCCVASVTASWSDLKVTWGKFTSLPLTQSDAVSQGWVQDTNKTCSSGSGVGFRYYLPTHDTPLSLFLLFNAQGHIAGIQGASQITPPKLISPQGAWKQDWVTSTLVYTLTMHFREPSTICSGTDSGSKIGDGLWFGPDGQTPTIMPPLAEKDMVTGAGTWGKGKCFWTMGNHYWYNVDVNAECESFFPLFLLYNGGKLSGFGWAMAWSNLSQPGSRWEHPTSSQLTMFFQSNQLEKCFNDQGRIFSTMHFYFSNPYFDFC